jgi:hypothetical protein
VTYHIDIDQDTHPDGFMFGIVDPLSPRRITGSVLCIESGKTPDDRADKSKHRGLRHVTGSSTVMHPHVWPSGKAVLP